MVNSTFAENHRGMWAAPEALPRMLDVRGQAIPINYITYYCQLSLIIDYYYLELCIDPLWWNMITHAETRLIFVIWHMKQTRPCQTRATHCDSLEARGIKAQRHFFIDTFFLGDQGQVFLFSHLISNLIYALYWNAHFKTIQGTQSGRFFTQSLRLDPIDWQPRWTYLASFK